MVVVYKFPMYMGPMVIDLPPDAQFLHAMRENGVVQMRFLLDPNKAKVRRRFIIIADFQPQECSMEHLRHCTTFIDDGRLHVWHIFEVVG